MKKSEIFAEKVTANPGNPLFRFSLAQALVDEGEAIAAIPHLEACVASRDDWMLPRILLGKALIENGQRERARQVLEDALALAVAQEHDDPAEEVRGLLADL